MYLFYAKNYFDLLSFRNESDFIERKCTLQGKVYICGLTAPLNIEFMEIIYSPLK